MDITEFLAGAKLPETIVPIVRDSSLLADREVLVAQITAMGRRDNSKARRADPLAPLHKQLAELDAKITDEAMQLRMRAARPDWLDEHRELSESDDAAYGYAIVAECVVDPAITVEQAKALRQAIGQSQWSVVMQAILALTYGEVPRTPFSLPTSEATP